jgi:hypothetical protein
MTLIMTCKIGKFIFEEGIVLSQAKLVRDAIMNQMLNPQPRTMRITNEEDAHTFIRSHDDVIARIPFEIQLGDGGKTGALEAAIRELAETTRITGQRIAELATQFGITKTAVWNLLAKVQRENAA